MILVTLCRLLTDYKIFRNAIAGLEKQALERCQGVSLEPRGGWANWLVQTPLKPEIPEGASMLDFVKTRHLRGKR